MTPYLVVCYSRTGHTRELAERIAKKLGCNVAEIRDVHPRGGLIGYWRSGYEASTGKLPPIRAPEEDPADYALIILGTPVWAGDISSPMRAYVQQCKSRFNRVAAFCTMGGSHAEKAFASLSDLIGKELVATLAVRDGELQNEQAGMEFVASLENMSRENASLQ